MIEAKPGFELKSPWRGHAGLERGTSRTAANGPNPFATQPAPTRCGPGRPGRRNEQVDAAPHLQLVTPGALKLPLITSSGRGGSIQMRSARWGFSITWRTRKRCLKNKLMRQKKWNHGPLSSARQPAISPLGNFTGFESQMGELRGHQTLPSRCTVVTCPGFIRTGAVIVP